MVLTVAMPAVAASSSDFYLTMLRKGISAYDAGRFDAAAAPLRVAAFGLVDSIEHYQTAHIYLALTQDRLGNAEQTRESARRVVTGERIASKYGSLQLPPATRATFEALARRVLTAADVAILGRSAQGTIAPQPVPPPIQAQTVPTPQPQSSSSQAVPPPSPEVKAADPVPVTVEPKPEPKKQDPPPSVKPVPLPATTNNNPTTPTRPAPAPIDVPARLTAAEKALTGARLVDARNIYRELLDGATLQRADLLRVAEGFYRARDFAHALRAFDRLGGLRRGEEPYRYYIAVALYETGQYSKAKQELDAVLPFIEQTPDVARYRVKIENAIN